MHYDTMTIGAGLRKLNPINTTWFIPVMQRPFVWRAVNIIELFRSIYSGYPIGTGLVWPTTYQNPNNDGARSVYMVHAHQAEALPPVQANVPDGTEITLVLDGQQRLTSLAVGVYGTWSSGPQGPKKLYFDPTTGGNGVRGPFRFVPQNDDPDNYLIWVGEILNWESDGGFNQFVTNYFNMLGGQQQAVPTNIIEENIQRFRHNIWTANGFCYGVYYAADIGAALNAFQLANDTGKPLKKEDLMSGVLQVAWRTIPLRTELPTRVRELNNRFYNGNPITRETYLNVFLLSSQTGLAPGHSVGDLTPDVITNLAEYWGPFQAEYLTLIRQLSHWGMTRNSLVSSTNAFLPILALQSWKNFRYGMENNQDQAEVEKVREWLLIVHLNQTFSGQTKAAVRDALSVIDEHGGQAYFPKNELIEGLVRHQGVPLHARGLVIDFIDNLTYQGNSEKIRRLLMLLKTNIQPADVTDYQIDHIFPQAPYADQYPDDIHKVWNLELLSAPENAQKTNQTPAILYQDQNFSPDWRQQNLLPENDRAANRYNIWDDPNRLWEERRTAMIDNLCGILNVE